MSFMLFFCFFLSRFFVSCFILDSARSRETLVQHRPIANTAAVMSLSQEELDSRSRFFNKVPDTWEEVVYLSYDACVETTFAAFFFSRFQLLLCFMFSLLGTAYAFCRELRSFLKPRTPVPLNRG